MRKKYGRTGPDAVRYVVADPANKPFVEYRPLHLKITLQPSNRSFEVVISRYQTVRKRSNMM